jgi:uncharacterized protein (TIGR02145 family)
MIESDQRCLRFSLFLGMLMVIAGVLQSLRAMQSTEDPNLSALSEYPKITVGDQIWMAENLGVTEYKDGTPIPLASDENRWSLLTEGAYCRPAIVSSQQHHPYGLLYNFHAVNDSRGLCPDGWHVPTAQEWHVLIDHLGGPELAGAKLKSLDAGVWRINVPGTSNKSGFSALPAGGRGRLGDPADAGFYATWWSSSSNDSEYAWHWGLHPDQHAIRFNPGHKASGFSVRCVRDEPMRDERTHDGNPKQRLDA